MTSIGVPAHHTGDGGCGERRRLRVRGDQRELERARREREAHETHQRSVQRLRCLVAARRDRTPSTSCRRVAKRPMFSRTTSQRVGRHAASHRSCSTWRPAPTARPRSCASTRHRPCSACRPRARGNRGSGRSTRDGPWGAVSSVAQLSAALPIVPAFSAAARSSGTVISARVQLTSIASFFMRANIAALKRPRVGGVNGAHDDDDVRLADQLRRFVREPDVAREVRPFATRIARRDRPSCPARARSAAISIPAPPRPTINIVAPRSCLECRPFPLLSSSAAQLVLRAHIDRSGQREDVAHRLLCGHGGLHLLPVGQRISPRSMPGVAGTDRRRHFRRAPTSPGCLCEVEGFQPKYTSASHRRAADRRKTRPARRSPSRPSASLAATRRARPRSIYGDDDPAAGAVQPRIVSLYRFAASCSWNSLTAAARSVAGATSCEAGAETGGDERHQDGNDSRATAHGNPRRHGDVRADDPASRSSATCARWDCCRTPSPSFGCAEVAPDDVGELVERGVHVWLERAEIVHRHHARLVVPLVLLRRLPRLHDVRLRRVVEAEHARDRGPDTRSHVPCLRRSAAPGDSAGEE